MAEVAAERAALLDESKWELLKFGWLFYVKVAQDLVIGSSETPDGAFEITRERLTQII